uniref:E1 domain-containing protein n=1 Tax=Timema tahoe TaxID=61484 RepID=A0A7R9IGH7_9NEOP|nr:unnamed protein product [Timema tahoe]
MELLFFELYAQFVAYPVGERRDLVAGSSSTCPGRGVVPRPDRYLAVFGCCHGTRPTCQEQLAELIHCHVYPKRDITNIVESSHFQKVSNWCKVGHKKCKGSHYEWVKPYRCLGAHDYTRAAHSTAILTTRRKLRNGGNHPPKSDLVGTRPTYEKRRNIPLGYRENYKDTCALADLDARVHQECI